MTKMQSTLNKHRLNNLLRGIQTSINLFPSQGHTNVYFTAQFFQNGKKQNSIERGDTATFGKQVRTYVISEEADAARVEFFDESTGKSFYSKAINDLRLAETMALNAAPVANATTSAGLNGYAGLNSFSGLGEAQVAEMVDRKVTEQRRSDEFARLNKEADELRAKYATLVTEKEGLDAKIKAKSDIEFYSGIIGAAFPGLAPLFNGTPLAQAAGFLAGTNALNGKELQTSEMSDNGEADNSETHSISEMVSDFCSTLDEQEAKTIHLLFMAFEADRSKIQSALHFISTTVPAPAQAS